jgi:G3E family GTPase
MIPVGIVTGFLGSGKTTLLGRLLRDPLLARTAVIVNELGEIPLDHALIARSEDTLVALTTGCLCCAIRTDLVQTLLELEARRRAGDIAYDRVLVETSGLADPAPILHALMTDADLSGHAIGQVVTLVDSALGAATLAAYPEARRQVAVADRLVLTKTDLAPPSPDLLACLGALNRVVPVSASEESPGDWLLPPPARPPACPVAAHTAGIASLSIVRETPVPGAALALLLQALAEHCGARLLRLKGLVDIAETPGRPAVIHGVQHVFSAPVWLDAWPDADRRTRIVLIGQDIPPYFPARLLDAILAEI